MKLALAAFVGLLSFTLSVPLIFANGGTASPPYACGQLGVILDTIRTLESGGNYQAQAAGATASGAYQYIDTTWRHWADIAGVDTDQYPRALDAPPHVQDQVAAVNVAAILADHDNNPDVVPVIWYYPAALGNPELMDQIPYPTAGNTLTVREYQTRWLTTYRDKLATAPDPSTCTATIVNGEWALPVPREIIDPTTLDDPHHDYPAWDYLTPPGTPIFAITGGTVVTVQTWQGNWWSDGCNTNNPASSCNTCGTGLTIQHPTGLRHTYCHATRLYVALGDPIAPGQHIADSGNTGRSGTPHLHLELRLDGSRLCPQPLLLALYEGGEPPLRLPMSGCEF